MARFGAHVDRHPDTGWELVHLTYTGDTPEESTSIAFAPEKGSNLLSFKVGGTEYLVDRGKMPNGREMILGTPVLYPSPNRVRNAEFVFEGRTFKFEPNMGPHFCHGMVREVLWQYGEPVIADDYASVDTWISMRPGDPLYERFPIKNTLHITYTLKPGVVRMDWTVTNDDEAARLPFGLAIHPYFPVIGSREQVRVQVPAKKWMEATALIPSGRRLDLADGPADLNQPVSLSELNLDDVFWGLQESKPQVIYYDAIGKKLSLTASDYFPFSVVYTPPPAPFFCVENQSCSTNAHNLHNEGLVEEASLSILNPGESLKAAITFGVTDI